MYWVVQLRRTFLFNIFKIIMVLLMQYVNAEKEKTLSQEQPNLIHVT